MTCQVDVSVILTEKIIGQLWSVSMAKQMLSLLVVDSNIMMLITFCHNVTAAVGARPVCV